MHLQVKVADSFREKMTQKPIHSLQFQAIAIRPPIGTDIHRPVIINVRKVSYRKSVKITHKKTLLFLSIFCQL